MLEQSALELVASQGERLPIEAYRRDFRRYRGDVRGRHSWKLERQQDFEEQDASWEAFRHGRWEEALRLLEDEREDFESAVQRDRERSTAFHRVRVVEEPLTPYLHWELHALRLQAECGKKIRVVGPAQVAAFEAGGPLPEVVVVGDQVLYQVLYTEAGSLDGAIRFLEPGLVRRWGDFIRTLYETGEDVLPFFARSVAHLPPPQTKAE
ncbi:hypothetical protein EST92_26795 [Streptomyces sp. TM32]|uniref:DUF6879 family protein n=1 Tax=Streptomyces sp. TM32 TaxID=1652669 RepID=UPI0010110B2B|nr:DUF6879 family protein [Streptomyces sp. TM32]RXS68348.1 hypothetical protein EST92_26795 [Streptomyces sp. TM32]